MAITSTSAVGTPTTTATTATTKESVSQSKDDFLRMLVAQLKQQDPMSPQDPTQFTQQMTQFSMLEQMLNMNSSMTSMVSGQSSSYKVAATQYIGKTVRVDDSRLAVSNGAGDAMRFRNEQDAAMVAITVVDSNGNVVQTHQFANVKAGEHVVPFDAVDSNGQALADGTYIYDVRAIDEDQNPIQTSTIRDVVVDGVNFEGNEPVLLIGGKRYAMDEVYEIRM